MRISDWSSDVCSSDLRCCSTCRALRRVLSDCSNSRARRQEMTTDAVRPTVVATMGEGVWGAAGTSAAEMMRTPGSTMRSEEHTSELQSLMRISYAVFCLNKKNKTSRHNNKHVRTHN